MYPDISGDNTLTRFEKVTSVRFEEHFYNGANYFRVFFTNGTIAHYYYNSNKATLAAPVSARTVSSVSSNPFPTVSGFAPN